MALLVKFLRLKRTEKSLVLRSFLLVLFIRLLLWLVPARLLQRLFTSNPTETGENSGNDWSEITKIVRSVRSVSRFVPRATCLTQALAASLLIRRSGQRSELKIGVAKNEQSQLIAHAWLETDGRIISGELPDQSRFVALTADSA
jgi:hypothetical protein